MNLAAIGIKSVGAMDGDVTAFLTTTGITDGTIASALNNLVSGLKTNGLWSKIIAFYPLVGGTATLHSYNLKNTSQYQISWSGSLTHNNMGVTGMGGYGNTGIVPSTALSLNDVHLSIYVNSGNSSSDGCDMGSQSTGNTNRLFIARYNWVINANMNDATAGFSAAGNSGFCYGSRKSADTRIRGANTTYESSSVSSLALNTHPIYVMAVNYHDLSAGVVYRRHASYSVGSGLTSGELMTFNTLIQAFQTALGRNV